MRQFEPRQIPAPATTFLRAASGFGMLEVLLGLMLLAVIASGIAPVILGSFASTDVADQVTRSTAFAYEHMETLVAAPFESDALAAGGDLDRSQDGYSIDPVEGDDRMFVRWQISDENGVMKRIAVRAGVRSATGAVVRDVRLETFRLKME